jgi:hypothetical protein
MKMPSRVLLKVASVGSAALISVAFVANAKSISFL